MTVQKGLIWFGKLRDQFGLREEIPFMDHWTSSSAPVSLRDIMIEEQVMQDSMEKVRVTHRHSHSITA